MAADGKKPKLRHVFGRRTAEFYAGLESKPIRVVFLDGKAITGVLIGLDQYDIILEKDEVPVLIPKHAIKYVTPATVENEG